MIASLLVPLAGHERAIAGLAQNLGELWDLARDPDTYVYFSGPALARAALGAAMAEAAGGADVWTAATGALRARNHWAELLFD